MTDNASRSGARLYSPGRRGLRARAAFLIAIAGLAFIASACSSVGSSPESLKPVSGIVSTTGASRTTTTTDQPTTTTALSVAGWAAELSPMWRSIETDIENVQSDSNLAGATGGFSGDTAPLRAVCVAMQNDTLDTLGIGRPPDATLASDWSAVTDDLVQAAGNCVTAINNDNPAALQQDLDGLVQFNTDVHTFLTQLQADTGISPQTLSQG